MTILELAVLCEWLMVADPWPLTDIQRSMMEDFADREAVKHGFKDWLDCYHKVKTS